MIAFVEGSAAEPRQDDFDLRESNAFVAAFPGIRTAFDSTSMARALCDALGTGIVACQPDRALFVDAARSGRMWLDTGGWQIVPAL